MQQEFKILPKVINTDIAYDSLLPNEAAFMKGIETSISANPDLGIGLNNTIGEGQNVETLTPTRSNVAFPVGDLPAAPYNKNIGTFESSTTQELYYFNFNSNGQHGIYVLEGNTFLWKTVIVDPELGFSDEQENFITEHRVSLYIAYDNNKNIVNKILLITDGKGWQKWVNVIAAIKSDGFNAALYPYWTVKQPHFDRRELFEWAVRPQMINPVVVPIANTPDETGKVNQLIDQVFQFATRVGNTDGRQGVFSSYSDPLIIKLEDYLNNPDNLPKQSLITIYAGSPLTEYIDIFVRKSAKKTKGVANTNTWGDWYWVERIYKFGNDPKVLTTDYWLRQNPWSVYSYDPIFNTIGYTFDNTRLTNIVDQADAIRLQNDVPQRSVAAGVLNDTAALADNLEGYDNAPKSIVDKLDVEVQAKDLNICDVPLRNIRLYAYTGRGWDTFNFCSQVGYFLGDDKQMRFGGVDQGNDTDLATIIVDESKTFKLDFADKDAFRCYLKGTPYYTDGVWYQVTATNALIKVDGLLDALNNDAKIYIQNTFNAGGYFVCVFDFQVPAGKYTAAIGRHNVASSGDYRNQSTYVMGIANSRIKSQTLELTSIKPNAIGSFSKEQELDCTSGDIDVWGNGADLFYIYCPYITQAGNKKYAFLEGYLRESVDNPLPVELFPYQLNRGYDPLSAGHFTDKNGFYFCYTKIANARVADVDFICRFNCNYPTLLHTDTAQDGIGWKPDNINYLTTFNSGQVGAANRVFVFGRVTNIDGAIGYSNIGVSIKDGATAYTDNNGYFTLIIHNGQSTPRSSNIYINAGGNFRIFLSDCGPIPLFNYNESLIPCSTNPTGINPCSGGATLNARVYPTCLRIGVNAEGGSQTSLKENASYSIGFAAADLAGRLMYVNVVKNVTVPSYLQTGEIQATYFRMLVNSALQFNLANPEMKWFAPYVSPQLNILKYLQWVGDKAVYINANGLVVNDPESAVFVSIAIDSLYNYNSANNFSLLANWQFTAEDRIRILDNGAGQLFDVATYGEPIDLPILGTNYNQAAQAAGIIPNSSANPVITINNTVTTSTATTSNNNSITLYVRYDARLNKIVGKTGFWIELYTPFQQTDQVFYNELKWKPIINGTVAEFTGLQNGIPAYNFPAFIDISYWDTYLYSRNIAIPDVGNKFFNHPFCSPNVSDSFGANLTSGGRKWIRNDNAKQQWKTGTVIKSDVYIVSGVVNGLGTFKNDTQHVTVFTNTQYGPIQAMIPQLNIILFICENNWFITNYDFRYAYANELGQMVVNLDSGLSRPAPKIGDEYGLSPSDISAVIIVDDKVLWYDRKNESVVLCDYRSAKDITDIQDKDGRSYGINSWVAEKTDFTSNWNATHKTNSKFDVVMGVDMRTNRVYITLRPRRINTNNLSSYVNQRENIDITNQETYCFDLDQMRWISSMPFTPEGYGKLRGLKSGVEMISFAAGKPYYHLNTPNTSFLNFYGQQTEAVILVSFNAHDEFVKIFQSMAQDILPNQLRIDMVYDNESNSYSYVPANQIVKKENVFYGSFLRDMTSYNSPTSTLVDGKRMFGRYMVVRLISRKDKASEYFQLSGLFYSLTGSESNKK